MANRIIFSLYMKNIIPAMRDGQKAVAESLGIKINQMETPLSHAQSIDQLMVWINSQPDHKDSSVLWLDIDALPLRKGVVEYIFGKAEKGELCGIAQRSNHINNNQHIYCGSPLVCLSMETWRKMGLPSAGPTNRGDVCEEWTYKAEELGIPVTRFYPTRFKAPPIRQQWETDTRPYWPLENDRPERHYGRGTFYAIPEFDKSWDPVIYHQFQAFYPGSCEMFVEECKKLVNKESEAGEVGNDNFSNGNEESQKA